jgi:hypothetical protein
VQLTGLAFKWPENNPANLISLAGQVWLKKEDLEQMILDMEQGRNPAIPFDQRMNIADGVIRTLTLRFNWPVDDEAGIYRLELGIDSGPGACVLETQW